jgi:branched-chain amino acid transport system ATP-binding protein
MSIEKLLQVSNLKVKYGNIEVLHGVNLWVKQGEIVSILGANGAGKSTTLLSISGLVKAAEGAILFENTELHKLRAHDIVRKGITQVPEGRRVFGTLTVRENLNMGAFVRRDGWEVNRTRQWVYDLFPILKERRRQLAGTLSGGEQQMLAIGRGLMNKPRILLLDEPSLGLAPLLARAIFRTLGEINQAGVTILLVEQNVRAALKLAHRAYVMEVGCMVLEDSPEGLLASPEIQNAYLGGGKR